MADTTDGGLEEAWSLLVHEIKVFQEHVEAFQQSVETTLNRGRYRLPRVSRPNVTT